MRTAIKNKFDAWLAAVAGRLALAVAGRIDNQLRVLVEMTDRLRGELKVEMLARRDWETRAMKAEARLRVQHAYFADVPPPSADEVPWTADDARALAALLESPVGRKLMQHLANRLSDYERSAVIIGPAATTYALCARARGFRDARGELLRLSAAGPSPANVEASDFALPEDLAHLRA